MPIPNKNSIHNLPPEYEKLIKENPEYKELILKVWLDGDDRMKDILFRSGNTSTGSSSPVGERDFFGKKGNSYSSGPSFTGSSSPASQSYRSGPSYTGSSSPIGGGYSSSRGGGCFIATVVYESPCQKNVIILKKLRDEYLIKSASGRILVDFYNRHSPSIARYLVEKPLLKRLVRISLYPFVHLSKCFLYFYSKAKYQEEGN